MSEYTHLEAELVFITFKDLLDHLESIVCDVVDNLLADPVAAQIVKTLNPDFVAPQRPFMRLDYRDAIKYLAEHGINKEDGTPHVDGDDIAEAAERKMTDKINRPIMLVHFPKHLKSFYMPGLKDDPNYTESVDILVPGVGEVVGGSMRISDLKELVDGYKREGIPMEPYYWFTDQRKYGTTEHGGYGLGVEVSLSSESSEKRADDIAIPSVDARKVHCPRVQLVPQVHGPSYPMIQAVTFGRAENTSRGS